MQHCISPKDKPADCLLPMQGAVCRFYGQFRDFFGQFQYPAHMLLMLIFRLQLPEALQRSVYISSEFFCFSKHPPYMAFKFAECSLRIYLVKRCDKRFRIIIAYILFFVRIESRAVFYNKD